MAAEATKGLSSPAVSQVGCKRHPRHLNGQVSYTRRRKRVTGRWTRRAKKLQEADDVFEVEAIVTHRQKAGSTGREYLLKWKGYADAENSWVGEAEMCCEQLLSEYLKSVMGSSGCVPSMVPSDHTPSTSGTARTVPSKGHTSDPSHPPTSMAASTPPTKKAPPQTTTPNVLKLVDPLGAAPSPQGDTPTKRTKRACASKQAPPSMVSKYKLVPQEDVSDTKKPSAAAKGVPPTVVALTPLAASKMSPPSSPTVTPSKMAPPTSEAKNVAPPTAEVPPSKNVAPPISEVPPSRKHSVSNVAPPTTGVKSMAPPTIETPPSKSVAMPTAEAPPNRKYSISNVVPPYKNMALPTSEAPPSKIVATPTADAPPNRKSVGNVAPPRKNIAPPTPEAPPSKKVAPPTSEAPPRKYVAPPTSEAPPRKNVAPPTPEAPPSKKVAPLTSEAPPRKNVAPPTPEAPPSNKVAPPTSEATSMRKHSLSNASPMPSSKKFKAAAAPPPGIQPLTMPDTTSGSASAAKRATAPPSVIELVDSPPPPVEAPTPLTARRKYLPKQSNVFIDLTIPEGPLSSSPHLTPTYSSLPSPTHSLSEPLSEQQLNDASSLVNILMNVDDSFELNVDEHGDDASQGSGGGASRTVPYVRKPHPQEVPHLVPSQYQTCQRERPSAPRDSLGSRSRVGVANLGRAETPGSCLGGVYHHVGSLVEREGHYQNGLKLSNGNCKVTYVIHPPPPYHPTTSVHRPPPSSHPPPSHPPPPSKSSHRPPSRPPPSHPPPSHPPPSHPPQSHPPSHPPPSHPPPSHPPPTHPPPSHPPPPSKSSHPPPPSLSHPHPPLSHLPSTHTIESILAVPHSRSKELIVSFSIDKLTVPGKKPEMRGTLATTPVGTTRPPQTHLDPKAEPANVAYRKLLQEWQCKINAQKPRSEPEVLVENVVDRAPIPAFTYIAANVYKSGVPDPTLNGGDSLVGCQCYCTGKGCNPKSRQCCAHLAGMHFAYSRCRRVKIEPGNAIIECNSKCSCPHSCLNRVVQRGRTVPLCIFRTGNGRGWGVKAVQPIRANSFVSEYVGEVITVEEAERREKRYENGVNYLFDLDYYEDHFAFTIDATKFGNVAHFFNHSCDPNLVVYSCWINTADVRLPRLAFFTTRAVAANEELTFDYQMNKSEGSVIKHGKIPCLCGASNCSGFVY